MTNTQAAWSLEWLNIQALRKRTKPHEFNANRTWLADDYALLGRSFANSGLLQLVGHLGDSVQREMRFYRGELLSLGAMQVKAKTMTVTISLHK